jgi:hypothetical protein
VAKRTVQQSVSEWRLTGSVSTARQTRNHSVNTVIHTDTTTRLRFRVLWVKQSYYSPGQALSVQKVEAIRFQDNRHMKLLRLSDLRTDRLYTQEIFLVLISIRGRVKPRAIVRPEGLYQ